MKNRGSKTFHWWDYHHDWQSHSGNVIEELTLTIYVNGEEFVSMMGTPLNQDWLAVGFLMNEGILEDLDEIKDLKVTKDGCCIDVLLNRSVEIPDKIIFTSGCGKGVTFNDNQIEFEPFPITTLTTPEIILQAFKLLQTKDSLYAKARGVHAAGLLDLEENKLIKVAEDIGRHNSIDKLRGACLLEGIPTAGRALLTTGRISSEMIRKGALMGCPVIASRTSPTSLTISLAEKWNITLIGYARHGKLRVYCAPERLNINSNAGGS